MMPKPGETGETRDAYAFVTGHWGAATGASVTADEAKGRSARLGYK